MKKRGKNYVNRKIIVGFFILILIGVILTLSFKENIFSERINSITGKGIVDFAKIEDLTTEEIIKNKDLIDELRNTNTIFEKDGITKEYIANEKEIKIYDSIESFNLKLLSDYTVYVPIGGDVKIAEFLLVDSNSNELFEDMDFYNVRKGYAQIKREFNLKYGTDYLEEVCGIEIDEKTQKEKTVCLNETKTKCTDFKTLDELPKGEVKIGLFTTVKIEDKFEWVFTIKGFEIYEWALVENTWNPDSAINASLPDVDWFYHLTPSVFYKDSSWYMIAGDYYGALTGFVWTGSAWTPNSTINASLPDIGVDTAPNVFYKDSSWYLLAGELNTNFKGFVWTGSAWAPNSTVNASFPDQTVFRASASSVF